MPDFDPVAYAQERLAPSLGALCDLASHNGEAAQHLFFERILHGIENAAVPDDLAGPFMELSTSAFLGFHLDAATAGLLDEVLAEAHELAQVLALDPEDVQ